MRTYSKTDIGKARDMNQDFIYAADDKNNIKLCILADGMGGYKGGEIASSMATISAKQYIDENFINIIPNKENIQELIRNSM